MESKLDIVTSPFEPIELPGVPNNRSTKSDKRSGRRSQTVIYKMAAILTVVTLSSLLIGTGSMHLNVQTKFEVDWPSGSEEVETLLRNGHMDRQKPKDSL